MKPPRASVLVLTRNAGPGFGRVLDALRAQEAGAREAGFGFEVVVVDSGSTDGTSGLARRHGASVHSVAPETFDHGATRDLGVSLCAGEYVALLVQDAVPVDGRWLAAMVEDLDNDPLVAGVYGRQLPRPESGPLTRALVNGWPTASPERREQFAGSPDLYRVLPPQQRRSLAAFDNVSSCVRRSVWERHPFGEARFGEDLRWGKRVVEAGHKLVYEPGSAVHHSHERGPLYDVRRHYVDARLLLDLFGLAPTPNLPVALLNSLLSSAHLYPRLRKESARIPLAAGLAARHAAASQLGAYLGAKTWTGNPPKARTSGLQSALDRFLSAGV